MTSKNERFGIDPALLRQFIEQVNLEEKHKSELRELAKNQGRLAMTPDEFDKEMIWVERQEYPGITYVDGYTLEDIDKERPSKIAFKCDDCEGWVLGHPSMRRYNTITFLAGARGEKFECTVCSHEIADLILEQS